MGTHDFGGCRRPAESRTIRADAKRRCCTEAHPDSLSTVGYFWRALDTSEALFAAFNEAGSFLTAQAIEVYGPITESLLRQAFAHLEKRHRLLRARIVYDIGPHWAEGAAQSPQISIIDRVPAGGIEALTEAELHRTYASSCERLWRCTWIPLNKDHHWIILALHHSVADGISGMVIVRDLIATCSALVGVGKLPPDITPGQTLDEVLPPVSWAACLRHVAKRVQSRLLGPTPILPIERTASPKERRTSVIFGSLPRDVVLALRNRATNHGTTISGVLAAALLASVRQTLGPLPLVQVNHSASLRGDAILQNQVGCFVASVPTLHPLRTRWSFWREAQSATAQLHGALKRGDPVAALRATRGKVAYTAAAMRAAIDDRRTAGRVGGIGISNRGMTGDFSAGPFRVASWYPTASHHTYGNGLQLSCATVGENFFFSLMHVVPLLSVGSAARIKDGFVESLVRAGRTPQSS